MKQCLEHLKKHNSVEFDELKAEITAKSLACVNATSENKGLKEQLSNIEQHFSVQERDLKLVKEEQEEEKEKQAKQLREMSKEMLEWQEQCKLLES